MKTSSCLASAILALVCGACMPQTFTMQLELRQPSLSGMDLGGKSIAVAYVDGRDSVFSQALATGFAETLEKDYFGGEQAVSIYRMPEKPGADYSVRDTLLNLVLDSGDDVVFLFDLPVFGEPVLGERRPSALDAPDSTQMVTARIPYDLRLYAYDSMDKADTVRAFVGASSYSRILFGSDRTTENQWLRRLQEATGETADRAVEAGVKSAARFKSVWKEEALTLYYYSSDAWMKAAEAAFHFRWEEAMNLWMSLLDNASEERRARLSYNLAVACYVQGDYDLAVRWLDLSDKDGKVELSDRLRRSLDRRI